MLLLQIKRTMCLFLINVVLTTAILLSQSMVWTGGEEGKGAGNNKKWVLVLILSHFVVFSFIWHWLSQSKKDRGRRSYWNYLDSFTNHQTWCRSLLPLSWESAGTAFLVVFSCRFPYIRLFETHSKLLWGQPWSQKQSVLLWFKEGHWACMSVMIGWVIWVCSLPFSEIQPSWLASHRKSLFWLSAHSFSKSLKIEGFRMLSDEVFCVDLAFMAKVLNSTHCPLPENHHSGSLKSKHPCQGGENKTGRDRRDRFLYFRKEENNDRVS